MEKVLTIPDEVWTNRCQWCAHRQTESNFPVTLGQADKIKMPCRILKVCFPGRDIPGECASFTPNLIFGICETCEYNNIFCEGYCTKPEQPNKRQVFIGQDYGGNNKPDYWGQHRLSTCDNYSVHMAWVVAMKKQAAKGQIPQNFNPKTMTFEENWTGWKEIEQEQKDAERQKQMEHERKQAEAAGQVPGQMKMF